MLPIERRKKFLLRVPLILTSIVLMALAILGGLARLGWTKGLLVPAQSSMHGPLMIVGFLGTFVSLERAVAFDRTIALLAPGSFAAGAILVLFGIFPQVSLVLWILGSLGLASILFYFFWIEKALHAFVLFLGSISLSSGIFLLRMQSTSEFVLIWTAFFVLTISAERLELSRLLRTPVVAKRIFAALSAIAFGASFFSPKILGISYVAITVWLFRFDVASRTLRLKGLPRYTAFCLIAGYCWLAISGILILKFGTVTAGPLYDAFLHSLFIGFVFSMIFGHAPIIFPAVTGFHMPYRPYYYLQFGLLHLSLIVRIVGDLLFIPSVRMTGAFLNAIAILVFLASTAISVFPSFREAQRR